MPITYLIFAVKILQTSGGKKMSLETVVEKESSGPITGGNGTTPQIYSPKLNKYVPLNSDNPKGTMQKYNIGMDPGSWY